MRKVDPEKHVQRRQEILDAASRCFVKQGFQNASMASICSEAGMSAGHVYHYFSGKDSIIEAMAERYLQDIQSDFNEIEDGDDPMTVIKAYLARVSEWNAAGEGLVFLDFVTEAARNERVAKVLLETSAEAASRLAHVLGACQKRGTVDPKLDVKVTAETIFAVLNGALLVPSLHKDAKVEDVYRYLSDMVEGFIVHTTNSQP